MATEISAVTLIAVPAIAYMENWEYAQFFIGSFLARVVIAFLFIPAFYHYNCTSIYEFLKYRFGPETQIAGSILFFITRLLASGVRLMVACLAVSILIGWPILPTILLFSVICILYVAWGGIKAVVWTNVVQGPDLHDWRERWPSVSCSRTLTAAPRPWWRLPAAPAN